MKVKGKINNGKEESETRENGYKNEGRNGMGLTYLFHSQGVVRVNLGDMLLQLGHLGGSIISYTSILTFKPAREDRKGVCRCRCRCRCRGTWTHLFCPNPLQRSTLNNSPSESCDNNPIIS
jgi:hypothetical protein